MYTAGASTLVIRIAMETQEATQQSVMVTAKCSWEIAMCGHAAYFDMQNATTKLELNKITISWVLFVCLDFFSGNNVSGTMQCHTLRSYLV